MAHPLLAHALDAVVREAQKSPLTEHAASNKVLARVLSLLQQYPGGVTKSMLETHLFACSKADRSPAQEDLDMGARSSAMLAQLLSSTCRRSEQEGECEFEVRGVTNYAAAMGGAGSNCRVLLLKQQSHAQDVVLFAPASWAGLLRARSELFAGACVRAVGIHAAKVAAVLPVDSAATAPSKKVFAIVMPPPVMLLRLSLPAGALADPSQALAHLLPGLPCLSLAQIEGMPAASAAARSTLQGVVCLRVGALDPVTHGFDAEFGLHTKTGRYQRVAIVDAATGAVHPPPPPAPPQQHDPSHAAAPTARRAANLLLMDGDERYGRLLREGDVVAVLFPAVVPTTARALCLTLAPESLLLQLAPQHAPPPVKIGSSGGGSTCAALLHGCAHGGDHPGSETAAPRRATPQEAGALADITNRARSPPADGSELREARHKEASSLGATVASATDSARGASGGQARSYVVGRVVMKGPAVRQQGTCSCTLELSVAEALSPQATASTLLLEARFAGANPSILRTLRAGHVLLISGSSALPDESSAGDAARASSGASTGALVPEPPTASAVPAHAGGDCPERREAVGGVAPPDALRLGVHGGSDESAAGRPRRATWTEAGLEGGCGGGPTGGEPVMVNLSTLRALLATPALQPRMDLGTLLRQPEGGKRLAQAQPVLISATVHAVHSLHALRTHACCGHPVTPFTVESFAHFFDSPTADVATQPAGASENDSPNREGTPAARKRSRADTATPPLTAKGMCGSAGGGALASADRFSTPTSAQISDAESLQASLWSCAFCNLQCSQAETNLSMTGSLTASDSSGACAPRLPSSEQRRSHDRSCACPCDTTPEHLDAAEPAIPATLRLDLDDQAAKALVGGDVEYWLNLSFQQRVRHIRQLAGSTIKSLLYVRGGELDAAGWGVSILELMPTDSA